MVLPDRELKKLISEGKIGIEPHEESMVQPASIDVRLDHRFRVFSNHRYDSIDPKREMNDLTELVTVGKDDYFVLQPGEFALGATLETVTIPNDLVSRLEGKSSLGRLGLVIHSTAGFIDPGFSGQVTLELSNDAVLPIRLYPGMKVGQLSFFEMKGSAESPYGSGARGSKYHGQQGPTPSQSWKNFVDEDEDQDRD